MSSDIPQARRNIGWFWLQHWRATPTDPVARQFLYQRNILK